MTKQIYQIKIVLKNSKPTIWRRVLVKSDILLADFHDIMQNVMGWTNSHLHQFEKSRIYYAPKEFELEGSKDYRKVRLDTLLYQEKEKIQYEYDFGDSWTHEITLEKILPFSESAKLPVCTAGKRNCPPEDCGGVWGYAELLEVISDPGHPEYEEMIEWVGGKFDPEYFDIGEINKEL
ncbi:MAG: plasmid pRiA4b ORF-3 family protein [Porphyromonadaceae bacterium]|nr:MAG: plasmid pRiA4b ORF-3 family protein [Porphyromonadaceae bacterium]